jgi:predicted RNA-binding protein with PUA domain
MKIAISGSMVFSEKMLEVKTKLEQLGHAIEISRFAVSYAGQSEDEKERRTVEDKMHNDAIREFWEKIKTSDALLVLNYDRKGIKNYIGGNTLLEIGFAHVLNKKIFLLNPIPDIDYYKSEIEATRPIILFGDLGNLN